MTTIAPRRLADVSRALLDHGEEALLMGGGTATVLMLKQGMVSAEHLVSLRRVADEEFHAVRVIDGHLHIGAGVTLSEVSVHELVRRHAPALSAACAVVGNVRVRNMATLGGVIAESDYASDPPAALVSLDAECLVHNSGETRPVTVEDVQTGYYETSLEPGDVIASVRVPVGPGRHHQAYGRLTSRTANDRPCTGVALRLALDEGRVSAAAVVVGGVAPTPVRLPGARQLVGASLRIVEPRMMAERLVRGLRPLGDERASGDYRRHLTAVLIGRLLDEARHEAMVVAG